MRIPAHSLIILFLAVLLTAGGGVPVVAGCIRAETETDNKVFLVLVDRLSIEDLFRYAGPVLNRLLEEGSLGVMNTRSARPGSESGYLSIATGTRAAAGQWAGLSFNKDEYYEGYPAGIIYRRYTGEIPRGEIFNISIQAMQRDNETLDYRVIPGNMGSYLSRQGKTVSVFGNADTDTVRRPAVMIAMDREGTVPCGSIGEDIITDDPLFPYGRRMNGQALAEKIDGCLESVSLIVVDWGDIARIDESSMKFLPARQETLMETTFKELDFFLDHFAGMIGPSNLFILAVPSPSRHLLTGGRQLTPLIITGGSFGSGLLVSPTTRRPGLVTNTDLPSTILKHLQTEGRPSHMGGTPAYTVAYGQPGDFLSEFTERVARIYEQRPLLLRGYLTFLILVLLVGMLGLAFNYFLRFRRIIIFLLEASMIFPLTLLILAFFPQFPPAAFGGTVVLVIAVNMIILGLFSLLKLLPGGKMLFWATLGLSVSVLIFADIFRWTSELQKFSFMGYDPVAGARFFGLGNEYMGVAIGAVVLGTAALPEALTGSGIIKKEASPFIRRLIPFIILYYITVIFLIASPYYGANAGGTLAAAVAFGFASAGIIHFAAGLYFRPVYVAGAFILIVASLWGFYQFAAPSEHWHLQSFLNQLMAGDFESVEGVIKRKINMNIRLLRYSVWAYALVAFLGLLVLLFFYPAGRMKKLKMQYPYLFTGIMAIVTGSVTALLLNDSGVVAAATTLLYGVPPLLIYNLALKREET